MLKREGNSKELRFYFCQYLIMDVGRSSVSSSLKDGMATLSPDKQVKSTINNEAKNVKVKRKIKSRACTLFHAQARSVYSS